LSGYNEVVSFQLVAGHVALDLVNTLDNRFVPEGPKELIGTFADLVRFCEESQLLNAGQSRALLPRTGALEAEQAVQVARELRETLAAIFYDQVAGRRPAKSVVGWLNSALEGAWRHRKLQPGKHGFEWVWDDLEDAHAPVWLLAHAAAELLAGGHPELVRECSTDSCRWLFLDTSKNHSRRWCDMKICGNRVKARRYYARHGSAGSEHRVG
jgi:predicted RNA-binding Zn ribbon-like protein